MNIVVYTDKNKKNANGNFKIYFRVSTDNGARFLISTGLDCINKPVGMAFPRNEPNGRAKTASLARLYNECEDFCIRNKQLSARQLKKSLLELIGGTDETTKTLTYYIDEFAKLKSGRTKGLYIGTRKKVDEFDSPVTFERVDKRWLTSFTDFLSKSMSVNGAAIHLRNLRAVFNYAIDEGLTRNYPFRKFSIKREETAKRNLTVEQMRTIRDASCESFLEPHRDMFMLMFYLIGINAVDLFNLKKSDYKNGRITYHRYKTGRLYDIKVEPEAKKLIEKWSGKDWLLFPHDTYKSHLDWLAHLNDGLKHIGLRYKLGIGWLDDKGQPIKPRKRENATQRKSGTFTPPFHFLSSYYSRHTWATFAAEIDIPVDVIGRALGHTDNRVTAIYINFNTKKVDDANRKVLDYIL